MVMESIIKIPFYDWNHLEDGVVFGYDGENLVNTVLFETDNIDNDAVYRLDIGDDNGFKCFIPLEKVEGGLAFEVESNITFNGEFKAQIVADKEIVTEEGQIKSSVKKSNNIKFRILDSVNAAKVLEEKYPEILDEILSAYERRAIELKYDNGTRYVSWRYINSEEWHTLFSVDEVSEGASAYQIAVKNGFIGTEEEWLESLRGEKGDTGFSLKVKTEAIENGTRVIITDEEGEKTFNVENGIDGYSPTVETEKTENGNIVYFTDKDGTKYILIKDGEKGDNGISPIFEIKEIENGTNIHITDVEGKKEFYIKNGFSPIIKTEAIDNGTKVTITYIDGEKTFNVENGIDGYSPTVEIEEAEDGKTLIITDKNGTKSIFIKNGEKGDTYNITEDDYQSIADIVLLNLVDGDGMSY